MLHVILKLVIGSGTQIFLQFIVFLRRQKKKNDYIFQLSLRACYFKDEKSGISQCIIISPYYEPLTILAIITFLSLLLGEGYLEELGTSRSGEYSSKICFVFSININNIRSYAIRNKVLPVQMACPMIWKPRDGISRNSCYHTKRERFS